VKPKYWKANCIMTQAVRARNLPPVVDSDIKQATKLRKSRGGDLGAYQNSSGPEANCSSHSIIDCIRECGADCTRDDTNWITIGVGAFTNKKKPHDHSHSRSVVLGRTILEGLVNKRWRWSSWHRCQTRVGIGVDANSEASGMLDIRH
jgi:hypothetical protein